MSINFVTVRADLISSLKCGCEIKKAVFPANYAELTAIWQSIGDDVIFLGGLTNTLVAGEIYDNAVFCERLRGISIDGDKIIAGAGERMPKVSAFARKNNLTGLESLSSIPGSIGAAVMGNAGCYGTEIADILSGVEVFRFDTGEIEYYSKEEVFFSYRYSNLVKSREMVTKVFLSLSEGKEEEIAKRTKFFIAKRMETQPFLPSLGSVFKRDNNVSAGYYIEKAGLKGTRIGGMQFSDKHANFIVNAGGTPQDYIDLVKLAERKVYETFGIKLRREVKIIGKEDGQF